MPPQEAGGGHFAGAMDSQPTDEFGNGLLDDDFVNAHSDALPDLPRVTGPSDSRREQPENPTAAYSGPSHDKLEASPNTKNTESTAVTRTISTKEDDPSSSGVINRPRSSGQPLDQGFKFGKAKPPQLDMARKRSIRADIVLPKGSSNEYPNGHAEQVPKDSPKIHKASAPRKDPSSDTREEARNPHPTEQAKDAQRPMQQRTQFSHSSASSSAGMDDNLSQERRTTPVGSQPNATKPGEFAQNRPSPATGLSSKDQPSHTLCSTTALGERHSPNTRTGSSTPRPAETGGVVNEASATHVPERTYHPAAPPNVEVPHQDSNLTSQQVSSKQAPKNHADRPEPAPQNKQLSSFSMQTQLQNPNAVKKQAPRNTRRPQPNAPMQNSQLKPSNAMDKASSRSGPARISKPCPTPKRQQGSGKANKPHASAESTNAPPEAGPRVHSNQVFGIWQKLFDAEQKELSFKENARLEAIQEEVVNLRCAEKEQQSALEAAKKARFNTSTKLKQVQNSNKELQSRIQELEKAFTDTSTQLKSLKDDQQESTRLKSALEEEVRSLKADKENLTVSSEEDIRRVSEQITAARQELREQKSKTYEATAAHELLEKQVTWLQELRGEESNRNIHINSHLKAAKANYIEIREKIKGWDQSLVRELTGLSERLRDIRENQSTKTSIEELFSVVRETFPQGHITAEMEGLLQSHTVAIQSSLNNARKSEEAALKAATNFEARLFGRLKEEFKSSMLPRDDVTESQKKIAILEERCSTLQADKSSVEEQLKMARSGETQTRDMLGGLQNELSQIRTHLTSVDSARLRELEGEKAKVIQDLEISRSRIRDEEEKHRMLRETERELRQTVNNLKEQLGKAETQISRLQEESSRQRPEVSKQIEDEKEKARAYFSKLCKEICQTERARHANELHEERSKTSSAAGNVRSQTAQIAALKGHIRRMETELRTTKDASDTANTEIQELRRQLEVAKAVTTDTQDLSESLSLTRDQLKAQEEQARFTADQHAKELQTSLEQVKTESAKELQKMQQQLNSLQNDKHESDAKHQQAQELNQRIQEQLVSLNGECKELCQDLKETRNLLTESVHEAEKQRTDAEEKLRQRDGEWTAECEDLRRQVQESNARVAESEANHQLKCREYEDQLQHSRQTSNRDQSESKGQKSVQHAHGIAPLRRALPDSRNSNMAVHDASMPAANSGQKRPRRKLDRSTNFSTDTAKVSRINEGDSQRSPSYYQGTSRPGSDNSESQRLTTPRSPGVPVFDESLWESQGLGMHESLTENGVGLHESPNDTLLEIPETIEESLTKPPLFSEFEKDQEQQDDHETSDLSSMITPAVNELAKNYSEYVQDDTSLLPDDEEASSPTRRLSDRAATRQMDMSIVIPFFEEDRPVSRANVSKRIESSAHPRRATPQMAGEMPNHSISHTDLFQTPRPPSTTIENGTNCDSSPPFMSEPTQRNMVVYGHNRGTQSTMDREVSRHLSTPSGAVKRRPSGNAGHAAHKRPKTASTTSANTRQSPRVTRASAKAGPRSHVSETQSQQPPKGSTGESQMESLKFESQSQVVSRNASQAQKKDLLTKTSQSQSQNLSSIPPISRMRSSTGPPSSATGTSPAKTSRRRKTSTTMAGRFNTEINTSQR